MIPRVRDVIIARKKVCSGPVLVNPNLTVCLDLECVYKEKGQPGLRPGYGKDVERRLSQLEANFQRMDQSLRTAIDQGRLPAVQQQETPPLFQQPSPSQVLTAAQTWQQPTNQSGLGMPMASSQTPNPVQFSINSQEHSMNQHRGLPPPEVLLGLTELYFELVQPWAPLFHKPTLMANLFADERDILLHGILVVTLRFWNKPGLTPDMREYFLKSSRERIQLQCADTCSVMSIQALALLAIDAIGQGPGTRIWMLMAMLAAAVQQLGLSKESPTQSSETNLPMVGNEIAEGTVEASSVTKEERRRLLWVIFSLDRFSSVSLGQPGSLSTKVIRLRFPSSEDDWDQASVAEWYQHSAPVRAPPSGPHNSWRSYIEILTLLDRSNRLLIHPFDLSLPAYCEEWKSHFRMLNVTLNTWLETSPEPCRRPTENFDAMWTTVRATYEL